MLFIVSNISFSSYVSLTEVIEPQVCLSKTEKKKLASKRKSEMTKERKENRLENAKRKIRSQLKNKENVDEEALRNECFCHSTYILTEEVNVIET